MSNPKQELVIHLVKVFQEGLKVFLVSKTFTLNIKQVVVNNLMSKDKLALVISLKSLKNSLEVWEDKEVAKVVERLKPFKRERIL